MCGSSWVQASPADPDAPPVDDPSSGVTDVRVSIQRSGHDGSVSAGANANFNITVTNYGPDDSTNTIIDFSWSAERPDGSPYPGYTTSTGNPACCEGFTLRSGDSVNISFSGRTEPSNYTNYHLAVTVTNTTVTSRSHSALHLLGQG